ncbi:MAG: CocE/NonD family hydrolase, partial [Gemmatimonadota bacterium]
MRSYLRTVVLSCAFAVSPATRNLAAQTFQLSAADVADSAALTRSMPRLAAEVLAEYQDSDRVRFLDNLFRLQMLTGHHAEALASLAELRSVLGDATPHAKAARVQYEILSRARIMERSGRPFRDAFEEAFREAFAELDDPSAGWAARAILVSARTAANDLWWATPDQTRRDTVSLEEALTLLHVYQQVESYRAFAGLPPALVAEDDRRRYWIHSNVEVSTPDGATVCARVVRPRGSHGRLPALLQFTIYADSLARMRDARLAAAHGYVGVIGYTRGKVCSPDRTVPYVHDGADAAALIDWIAAQPWSDGRVGMYGGSYSGFTAWAAAKHMPQALRALMVGAPAGPGIDVPMEGNIFWNFVYPWPFYTTNNRFLDNATYYDNARWNRLYREWYSSGRPYRALPEI